MEHGHGHGHGAQMTPEQQKLMIEQEIKIAQHLGKIKYKIAVMSGKGGVGKSTVAANLAEAFQKKGFKTGILDADIHGPNIPKMLGVDGNFVTVDEENLMVPIENESGIEVMSMAFLLDDKKTPIIWRGPQKTGTIKQLISDVNWGDLDVLIIDNPPGTGDEPLTVLQTIPNIDAVVMVTTPNDVSQDDVVKCVGMVDLLNIKKIGLVENMAYFPCPHCEEPIKMFGENQGAEFAEELGIEFLGDLPLTPRVADSANLGKSIVSLNANSELGEKFMFIADEIEKDFFEDKL